ncbi:cell division protein CrgA [Frankia sp. CNm7]|uniref:Cell division protein CrgA n=1 Tax=Frankia nepalensis TaxID=1836974 RepID=A0A937RA76_9ACTN|nr:cell division protein CrgA [Frankia nepalensis]MBL7494898.1 cell division protein CrgA [Frankia nepalensis]MBL7515928.1 cell division protein CrgA [Frankia nepalensis]MBL7521040.1 cell division protein CrgA [Frankia nepalensis]MBL7626587.1 cell division protein CrgA [Frankia nepalensis]
MPESRRRKPKNATQTRATTPVVAKRRQQSPRWFGGVILAFFLIGIAYLLTYYFSNGGVFGMEDLGGWNILIGFGFVVIGLGVATQWH